MAPPTDPLEPLPLRRRLSARVGVGVVLVLVAALLVAGAWIGHREQERFEEQHRDHAAQVSRMVARLLSERMLAGGGAGVWRDVAAASRELQGAVGAARIVVLARDGKVKATTDASLEGHRFSRETDPECVACHGAGMRPFPSSVIRGAGGVDLLRVVGAIEKLPGCVACHREPETFRGMIAIDFDLSALREAGRDRMRLLAGIGAAAAAGMIGLVALLLRALVHVPLGDLSRSARAVGEGDLGSRIAVRRDDELGRLAGEFNRMAGRIQDQVDRIEAGRREMELLYNLVVEVSSNMEVSQVRAAVLKVLGERLPFERVLFAVATGEEAWSTEVRDGRGGDQVFSGGGALSGAAAWDDAAIAAALPGAAPAAVREACRERRAVRSERDGLHTLVLPLEQRGRIAGIVVAEHLPAAHAPDEALLENLTAHIGLALDNAFNFTRSITDGLTGLANKRHAMVRLEEALYVSRRHGVALSLMMADIDHFKKVNDTHGHLAGDAVLKAVAGRLRAACRAGDLVARYGGEEFMIIQPHTPAEALADLGERLRGAVAGEPATLPGGAPLSVTVSVGAAACDPVTDTAETLVARADAALYEAKRGGRNRVVVAPAEGQS